MTNPRVELAVTLIFAGATLAGLFLTSRIDLSFSSDLETYSGPRAYPGLILSVMLVIFAGTAASQLRDALRKATGGTEYQSFFDIRSFSSAALFAALLVFVLTFEGVGYILTMVPLLTVVALLSGAKSKVLAFIVAVCLAATCLVVFRYGLATVLPEGWLGIDAILRS